MGHDHAHQVVEENPKVTSTAALFFVLIIIGLVVGFFNFVQSMSHTDDHHGDATHVDEHHSWSNHTNLEYDATALAGGKAPQANAPVVAPTNVSTTDSTAPNMPTPSKDSTTVNR